MKAMIRLVVLLLGILLSAFFPVTLRADSTAISFDTSQSLSLATGTGIYGWQFSTTAALQVNSLGLFDNANVSGSTSYPGDGLLEAHTIYIWDVANQATPLTMVGLAAGTAAPLINGFRYSPIDPVILPAGHEFVIASSYGGQDWDTGDYNNLNFLLTVDPAIVYEGYRADSPGDSSFPEYLTSDHEFGFGPDFTFTAVPEPSSITIGFVGIVALICFARVRKGLKA